MPKCLAADADTLATGGKDEMVRVTLSDSSPAPARNALPAMRNGSFGRILPDFFFPGRFLP